ncbi:MAG: F0F1 ATP synthase subunit B [Acidimicrobiales bacterium]
MASSVHALLAASSTDFLSPITTFGAELLGFAIVLWALWRYVGPWIRSTIRARQTAIREELAAAEEGRALLAGARLERERMLAEAREQARGLVDQAGRVAAEAREEILAKAAEEHDRLIARGEREAARTGERAAEEVRRRLVETVVAAAERVVQAEADDARQRALVEEVASTLDRQTL